MSTHALPFEIEIDNSTTGGGGGGEGFELPTDSPAPPPPPQDSGYSIFTMELIPQHTFVSIVFDLSFFAIGTRNKILV